MKSFTIVLLKNSLIAFMKKKERILEISLRSFIFLLRFNNQIFFVLILKMLFLRQINFNTVFSTFCLAIITRY